MQVLPEHLNGARLRRLGELVPNVALHRWRHETRVTVRNRAVHRLGGVLVLCLNQAAAEGRKNLLTRCLDIDPQNLFLLAAVHGEHAVAGRLHQRLTEIIVGLVDRPLLSLLLGFVLLLRAALLLAPRRAELTAPLGRVAHVAPNDARVGKALREYIQSTLDAECRRTDPLLLGDETLGLFLETLLGLLRPDEIREFA